MPGGGYASLAVNPDKALKIIDQAIDDVSMTRARLDAVQTNILPVNSLSGSGYTGAEFCCD